MKKGYKICMGTYNVHGVCNKCCMTPRGCGHLGGAVGVNCYRNVPRKRYKWINIEDKLPPMNKTVLVKSNHYGVQESQYIRTNKYLANGLVPRGCGHLGYDRTVHTFDTSCPSAKTKWDSSVIQWTELVKEKE